ncbi:MAG TPA: DoxX family protein [Alphaproteobacteria bacterium]|nr:DoxX family protein [Alphaproteobacteria bacterium]
MVDAETGAARLFIPGLAGFYRAARPLSYALMRVCLGLMLMPHGFGKLFGSDLPHTAENFLKHGWPAPLALATWIGILEFFGGAMLALGLLTRLVAAMIAVEMAVICFVVLWPNWEWAHHGMEYPFMMGIFAFAMALGGGGRYSLDRAIGTEL